MDYYDARITGVGLVAGENEIRFTIDKDPNVVLRTTQFSGDQLKRLVALITTAYATQSKVYLVRSSEATSSATRHYSEVVFLALGTTIFD